MIDTIKRILDTIKDILMLGVAIAAYVVVIVVSFLLCFFQYIHVKIVGPIDEEEPTSLIGILREWRNCYFQTGVKNIVA